MTPRTTTPPSLPAGETKVQERRRSDGEEKENTGAASGPEQFVWTDTGAFPRGNRSWRENTGRQEHGERIKHATKFFLGFFFGRTGGQRKPFFCVQFGLSQEVKARHEGTKKTQCLKRDTR